MTEARRPPYEPSYRRHEKVSVERRRPRRRLVALWFGRVLFVALVFWFGIALGRAVAEAPKPGGTQTLVRTLEPASVPAVTQTVTVTSSVP